MIKAVIFDVGGVILAGRIEDISERTARKLGVDTTRFEQARTKYHKAAQTGELSTGQLLENVSRDLGVGKGLLEKAWLEAYDEMPVDHKVLEIVDALNEKGCRVALITNTTGLSKTLHEKYRFHSRFNPLVESYKVGFLKPDRGIYEKTLKDLGTSPSETIFIDDRAEHLVPAQEIGLKTILFKDAEQLKQKLSDLGAL